MHTYLYAHMPIHIYVCMCLSIYVFYISICTYTNLYVDIHTHNCMLIYISIFIHANLSIHACTYMSIYMHIYVDKCRYMYIDVEKNECTKKVWKIELVWRNGKANQIIQKIKKRKMEKSHNPGKIHGKNRTFITTEKKERNAHCRKSTKQPGNQRKRCV